MSFPELPVAYCGLRLRNPLVVAPAAITETADHIKRCEDAGAAAAVMKSYFEFEPARRHATPRFRIIRHRAGIMSSAVLYSYEQASVFDLDRYCEEIRRAKEACDIPVFASLNCNTEKHWAEACRAVEQAGADGIELNVSCPHGTHLMGGADIISEKLRALAIAKAAVDIPIVVKMTPQLERPDLVARRLQSAGADAVVMFNRFTGLDIDLDSQRPIMHGGYAGHGGPWALHYVLRWLTATYPHLSIPIAASGGVMDGDGAAKLVLAGATVVQVCSAVVVDGYQAIGRILRGLADYLDRCGADLDAIRGIVCDRIVDAKDVDRRNRFFAQIDAGRCTACGRCQTVCVYGAVRAEGDKFAVDPDVCDGCGLCAELCPAGAIELAARPQPLDRRGL